MTTARKPSSQRSTARKRLNNASKDHRALLLSYGLLIIKLGELMSEWRDLSYKARPESDYRHPTHLHGILRTQSVVFARCADQLHAVLRGAKRTGRTTP